MSFFKKNNDVLIDNLEVYGSLSMEQHTSCKQVGALQRVAKSKLPKDFCKIIHEE